MDSYSLLPSPSPSYPILPYPILSFPLVQSMESHFDSFLFSPSLHHNETESYPAHTRDEMLLYMKQFLISTILIQQLWSKWYLLTTANDSYDLAASHHISFQLYADDRKYIFA